MNNVDRHHSGHHSHHFPARRLQWSLRRLRLRLRARWHQRAWSSAHHRCCSGPYGTTLINRRLFVSRLVSVVTRNHVPLSRPLIATPFTTPTGVRFPLVDRLKTLHCIV